MTRLLTISLAVVLTIALVFGIAISYNESGIEKIQQWDMPDVLKEISGIAYMGEGRFACIQDEKGTIFIVNIHQVGIEKKIPFAGKGDYEDIALSGKTAYVVRSDGKLFEVADITRERPQVKEYETPLTAGHNVEGMCFDQKNNRLLLAIKDTEPGNKDYKGIYAFDLAQKEMVPEPVLKINLTAPAFESLDEKHFQDRIKPAGIAIHPVTGHIYIIEGSNPKIVVLDSRGKVTDLYPLDKDTYAQPEGITFSPEGDMYISNEGKKGESGNIMQIKINRRQ